MEAIGINLGYLLLQIGCVIVPAVVGIGAIILLIRNRNRTK